VFRIESDQALVQAFRPRDRRLIEMPAEVRFPHFVRDYLVWTETSGARVYLVFGAPGTRKPVGVIFRREVQPSQEPGANMCDWCHTFGSNLEVGLLTVDVTNRRRAGMYLCRDLRCKEKVEDGADRAGRHPLEAFQRLNARIFHFAQEVLGIPADGVSAQLAPSVGQ
jgi:hypothetical protein